MANNVVHFEIYVDNIERAKRFYTDVFGWAFQELGKEYNDYVLVYPDGEAKDGAPSVGINGGMMLREGGPLADTAAAPNAFVCTVAVEDVDAILEKVDTAGGRIDMPAADVPGVGRLAYVRDSEMNLVGVLAPAEGGAGM